MIGGGRPLLPEILGQTDRVGAKSPIFDVLPVYRSASPVTPSEKSSINTHRKSNNAFQWAQDEHCTLSLSTQARGCWKLCPKCVQNLKN